ncbi:LPS-assembly protein LptD [Novosphingobium aerophilum]|uniref:LPS-assembly protein LptD n=1 Tax=Novosphingobium TaxID=165696 RepID=UPI0006C8A7DA|nr:MULTISPECIES: LPS assembly protein LptD [unclassified Novosphingobium]KPH59310.1 organic solvent tolerance protein [Novosphingobium sp. ST904]MPS69045.1 LPS-assembly protein LptD [Novosphingobium sp.]TCM40573.1 LPS-assembly protein [Novosphingobium sp. ST904]WRT92182.1 LPS assembly protein LptD [Novosphingobium sp. RL4]
MLPAAPSPLQAPDRRLRPISLRALALGIACIGLPAGAWAQDLSRPVDTGPIEGAPAAPPASTDDTVPIAFEADTVEYAQNDEFVTATGNVVLRKDKQSVRADKVTWNRKTGQILGSGNVRMVDQDGNQLYTESVELTDELKTGMMENLLLVMRQGGRLAANKGERIANGDVVLQHAAYTGCAVENDEGCPKTPTWRVVAKTVVYSETQNRVRFSDARLELFGAVQLPLFGLSVSTNGGAVSGFLVPDLRSSPSNGIEVAQSYYWKIAENRDLTGSLHAYTKAAPMASFQYRALTDLGAYQITGYATSSNRIPINSSNPDPNRERAFRGYIFANGKFQLDENWSITASIRRATDRTFVRRYDISRDDRLRSSVELERIDQDSYFSFAGYATQTLQSSRDQGMIPVALPVLDYRHRFDDPLLGGKIETQVNTMAVTRVDGQDTQRAFASTQWSLRKITGLGQEVTFTGLVRGDVYHSDENDLTTTALYRGNAGWQGRAIALAAVDVKWPLVGQVFGGSQVLTPRIQFVATPPVKNLAIPNEDSRAIELEDSNLFALNRFPGYDRFEDGARVTYGFDWMFERPRWRIKSTIGQSVRLSNKPSILPDGTGLTSKTSDIVGRTELRYRNFFNIIHRFRVDKDTLAVRRNEFDIALGNNQTYLELGYTKLNRDISMDIEDLKDREEVRAAGRVAFANYWSMFGSAVVNLTDRNEDPTYGSDGFQPLRTRVGMAYEDDCLQVSFTWRRDYVTFGDARKGNSFQLGFALKNIGAW